MYSQIAFPCLSQAVSETGSIGMGVIEEEMDITDFTEVTKFHPEVTSGDVTPDGASIYIVDDGGESEPESIVVSIESSVGKPGEGESSWRVALQVFFPFIVAGLGMVGAGVLLGIVQVNEV